MILAAAVLVLVALGLFVGGIATGATALFWACVAVSAVAAVLLVLARRRVSRPAVRDAGGVAGGRTAAAAPTTARDEPGTAVTPAAPSADPAAPGPPDVIARPPDPETSVAQASGATAAGALDQPPGGDAAPPAADRTVRHRAAQDGAAPDGAAPDGVDEEPPVEEVEVTDLLLVVDLRDDVFVVDEHPRYHLADCPHLRGRTTIPLPIDEARTDGFTPCARCAPDRHLAEAERARRASRRAP